MLNHRAQSLKKQTCRASPTWVEVKEVAFDTGLRPWQRLRSRPVLCLDLHPRRTYYLYGTAFGDRFQTFHYGEISLLSPHPEFSQEALKAFLSRFRAKKHRPLTLRLSVSLPGLYQTVLKFHRTLDSHFLAKPVLYLLKKELPGFRPGDYWRWELLRTHLSGPSQIGQVLVQVFPGHLLMPWLEVIAGTGWQAIEVFHVSGGLVQALRAAVDTVLPLLCVVLHPQRVSLCLVVDGRVHLFRQLACPLPDSKSEVSDLFQQGHGLPAQQSGSQSPAATRFGVWLPERLPSPWRTFLGTLQTLLYGLPEAVMAGARLVVCGPAAARLPLVEAVARLIGKPALVPVPRMRSRHSESLAAVAYLPLVGLARTTGEKLRLHPFQQVSAS